MSPLVTPNVQAALHFARQAHEGQERKYTGEPYINHPIQVATIVANVGADEKMIMAALLHDTLEDCPDVTLPLLRRFFGYEVAQLVKWLTDEPVTKDLNRAKRKARDRERLAVAPPPVQTIKLADLIDNTRDVVAHDPKFAATYLYEKDQLLKVLTRGNIFLHNVASEQVRDEMAKLPMNALKPGSAA